MIAALLTSAGALVGAAIWAGWSSSSYYRDIDKLKAEGETFEQQRAADLTELDELQQEYDQLMLEIAAEDAIGQVVTGSDPLSETVHEQFSAHPVAALEEMRRSWARQVGPNIDPSAALYVLNRWSLLGRSEPYLAVRSTIGADTSIAGLLRRAREKTEHESTLLKARTL